MSDSFALQAVAGETYSFQSESITEAKEISMRQGVEGEANGWSRLWAAVSRVGGVVTMMAALVAVAVAPAVLLPDVAVAQDDAAADDSGDEGGGGESALVYYARALGWVFGPAFLLLSFFLVSILVMCLLQIRRAVVMPDALRSEFEALLDAKEYQQAYELVKEDNSYFGKVMAAGMAKIQSGYPIAVEAMRDAGAEQGMALEHKISYISLVGAIAPMLGLLGTVSGMVGSFQVIAQSATAPKPSELATGISQALVTTLVGIMLAIPAIAAFALLKNWLQTLNADVDTESTRLMSRFQAVGKK
jgi:biopolymer transport protein ExbB